MFLTCYTATTTVAPTPSSADKKLIIAFLTVAAVVVVTIVALIAWRVNKRTRKKPADPPPADERPPTVGQSHITVQSPGVNYFIPSLIPPYAVGRQPAMLWHWRRTPHYQISNVNNRVQWIPHARLNNISIPTSPRNLVI